MKMQLVDLRSGAVGVAMHEADKKRQAMAQREIRDANRKALDRKRLVSLLDRITRNARIARIELRQVAGEMKREITRSMRRKLKSINR